MKVQLAWPWTGPDGKKHKKGDVIDVPDHRGRELKRAGIARDPDKDKAGDPPAAEAGKGRQKEAGK